MVLEVNTWVYQHFGDWNSHNINESSGSDSDSCLQMSHSHPFNNLDSNNLGVLWSVKSPLLSTLQMSLEPSLYFTTVSCIMWNRIQVAGTVATGSLVAIAFLRETTLLFPCINSVTPWSTKLLDDPKYKGTTFKFDIGFKISFQG
jgi:hypothetical protein